MARKWLYAMLMIATIISNEQGAYGEGNVDGSWSESGGGASKYGVDACTSSVDAGRSGGDATKWWRKDEESSENAVRREGIDSALRKYALMAVSHARTGIPYVVPLPPSLNGISSQAMRVRSGSTHRRGLFFNEFHLPQGVIISSGGPFVLLIYRKIFNFSVYSLPPGYVFVSPVVGILVYTSPNTSFHHLLHEPLPEMTFVSPSSPMITAHIPISLPFADPLCAFFHVNGTATFLNLTSPPNICSSTTLMDVALVVNSSQTSPPAPSHPPITIPVSYPNSSYVWKFILVAVCGGIVGVTLLTVSLVLGVRVSDKCKLARKGEFLNNGETLQTSWIGQTRAPTAAGVRTKPTLETGSLHT